ncbi:complex 1 protein [Choanephora cucurbitarum]|nr:complex 1 protein [Choanephora cucurbitarum]
MLPTLVRLHKAPAMPKFFQEGLTLDHFILRGQVISLYRSIVRCTKGMDKANAKDLIQFARADFERHRHETNLESIRSLISVGKYQMHSLQSSVSLAHTSR